MGKLSTERVTIGSYKNPDIDFKYDISVDKDGYFTTTLPLEIAKQFKEAGIDLQSNRLKNYGFIQNITKDGLMKKVYELAAELVSRELISETIVIQYQIQTTCAYCLDVDNKIVPNASSEWTRLKERRPNDWKSGTLAQHATERHPFGIQVYAKPSRKQVYRFKTGREVIEYDDISAFEHTPQGDDKSQYYLAWLSSIASIKPPRESHIQEIDYTEPVAKFFVDMLIAICSINEKIKDFLTPDKIQLLADNNKKLLG